MARYPQGQPITLDTTIRVAGVLTDPTTLALTVRRPDGTDLPAYTYNPGPVVRDSAGVYHCDVPTADIPAVGHYQDKWVSTGVVAGVRASAFDVHDPFEVQILTLPDAKEHLNIAPGNTQHDTMIQIWLDTIDENVERAIGGPVVTRAVTERVEAVDGGRALPLRRRPVVAVTSVTSLASGQAVDVTDVEVDPNSNIARRKLGVPFLTTGPPVFTVVYTAGLGTSVSAPVSAAARIILDHLWEIQRGPSARPAVGGEDTTQMFGMSFAIPNRALELLGANLVEAWI